MATKPTLLLLFFLLSGIHCASSDDLSESKREFESAVSFDDFPSASQELLLTVFGEIPDGKFFMERDGELLSYEAKVEIRSVLFTIEFLEEGYFQDIEKLVSINEVPDEVSESMISYLDQTYDYYRITRLQIQYSGLAQEEQTEILRNILSLIDDEDISEQTKIAYELEIEARSRQTLGAFELLFDNTGQHIQSRRIERRSLDNIW